MPSNAIQITPVQTRSQQKQFTQMAWDLYRGDPNWIPPLRMNQKELLNFKRHPFYDNAEIQPFLAEQNGKIVGRIAAIIDHGHNRQHDEKRGIFGFFESIEDEQVSGALFQAVTDWQQTKGMDCLRGPLNPAMNHECGLLVDGFEYPPTFMMTYNKPYYGRLIEAYGYEKSQDLYAYWGHVDMLPQIDPKVTMIAEQAKERFDIKVRRISQKNFAQDVESFLDIYNKALPGTWGFVPLTQGELKHMATGLKQLIVPEMTTIAEKDGKPIGCVFGLLDYNPVIKKIDGRLFPFGFMHLLYGRKKIKRVRLVSTNVMPEWQRWGIGIVLINRLVEDIRAWGIEEGEFSWVLESNHLSKATWNVEARSFRKPIASTTKSLLKPCSLLV
nr:protein YghO-like [Nerophis lumbriciformis]